MSISLASGLGASRAHATEPREWAEAEMDEQELTAPYAPSRTNSHAERWYGWQTLLGDTASVTFFLATGKSLQAYALIPYATVGPTIHFAHGNVAMGFVSFGTRLFLPLAGGLAGMALGSATDGCDGEIACLGSGAIGFVVGMAAAITIDASLLAYDEGRRSAPASHAALRIAPSVAYDGRKGTFGLAGRF